VAKAKKDAETIVKELTRAKPDSNFLTRLLQSTMRHNKRVLEQIEEMERKESEEDAKSGNAIRITGISELVRMYLQQGAGMGAVVEGADKSPDGGGGGGGGGKKAAPPPVSRMASALFGVGQGTVMQKRLSKQYGLGAKGEAEKKAEALANKAKQKAQRRKTRPVFKPSGAGGRSLFGALTKGVLGEKKPGEKKPRRTAPKTEKH